MTKILIVYWSTTWNTQSVAEEIEKKLIEIWNEVTVFSWDQVKADKILNYDFTFIWSSTWWDWELQDDMVWFIESMKDKDLSWKKVAVFATWMSSFPKFCNAWNIIEKSLKESKATIVKEMFKIDWDVFSAMEDATKWAVEALW